ncbi:hypothetical protein VUR80DRAFT_1868 [Thermomyces stellatus]
MAHTCSHPRNHIPGPQPTWTIFFPQKPPQKFLSLFWPVLTRPEIVQSASRHRPSPVPPKVRGQLTDPYLTPPPQWLLSPFPPPRSGNQAARFPPPLHKPKVSTAAQSPPRACPGFLCSFRASTWHRPHLVHCGSPPSHPAPLSRISRSRKEAWTHSLFLIRQERLLCKVGDGVPSTLG